MSQRTYNWPLKRSQITRVGQILERTPEELLQLRNFGQKSLQELQDKLRQHDLSLPGMDGDGVVGLEDGVDLEDSDELDDDEGFLAHRCSATMLTLKRMTMSDFIEAFDTDQFEDDEDESPVLTWSLGRGLAERERLTRTRKYG